MVIYVYAAKVATFPDSAKEILNFFTFKNKKASPGWIRRGLMGKTEE